MNIRWVLWVYRQITLKSWIVAILWMVVAFGALHGTGRYWFLGGAAFFLAGGWFEARYDRRKRQEQRSRAGTRS